MNLEQRQHSAIVYTHHRHLLLNRYPFNVRRTVEGSVQQFLLHYSTIVLTWIDKSNRTPMSEVSKSNKGWGIYSCHYTLLCFGINTLQSVNDVCLNVCLSVDVLSPVADYSRRKRRVGDNLSPNSAIVAQNSDSRPFRWQSPNAVLGDSLRIGDSRRFRWQSPNSVTIVASVDRALGSTFDVFFSTFINVSRDDGAVQPNLQKALKN